MPLLDLEGLQFEGAVEGEVCHPYKMREDIHLWWIT
jgi:hypothetical protein